MSVCVCVFILGMHACVLTVHVCLVYYAANIYFSYTTRSIIVLSR